MISSLRLFFFNDTATTEIYTLSLHDALPICSNVDLGEALPAHAEASILKVAGKYFGRLNVASAHFSREGSGYRCSVNMQMGADRKSTRLNSSHANISYAVFCLKKKTRYATLT